ncbi:MAG: undecaprenyl/decaprenyl-phosphate alpha-N-acetylglucosaminyl 1-phosphate transferase, partial [Chloroflexi bacterium]|nr:undecaprenyl/decaprenyl-phosphate alpha-N-acetylglucosaminyl 1-phosphate transferase [Chloroflexota bacterium]
MTQYALVLITAFVGAISATPVARRLAVRLGVVDQP